MSCSRSEDYIRFCNQGRTQQDKDDAAGVGRVARTHMDMVQQTRAEQARSTSQSMLYQLRFCVRAFVLLSWHSLAASLESTQEDLVLVPRTLSP